MYIISPDAQHQQQWTIAEDLRISGESDGYDGTKPQHPDVDYLQGYVEGCRRKLAEVNALLAEFQKETAWIEEF